MSRARDWTHPITGEVWWFDSYSPATLEQVEVLAEIEDIDIDDLLDAANLHSREVLFRLNSASDLIPIEVIRRKRERRERIHNPPPCLICSRYGWGCEGRMTRHHFVPRWVMLELSNYNEYAPRSMCTFPVCAGRHKDLHSRANGCKLRSKSVVAYLNQEQRWITNLLVQRLKDERPVLYDLISQGSSSSYEHQLIHDWRRGAFSL